MSGCNRSARRCALLVLGVSLAAELPVAAQTMPSPTLLARQFETIAFSSEFAGAHRRDRLVKWQEPVVVRLRGANPEWYRDEVEAQLAELRRLSGLAMTIVAANDLNRPANLTIQFSHALGDKRFDRNAHCLTVITDRAFVIRRAEVHITSDPPDLRQRCIAEELTQALGLANDSTVIPDSIFNGASRRQRIAPWDALLVRVLYDHRLAPGMHKSTALPLARELIALGLVER